MAGEYPKLLWSPADEEVVVNSKDVEDGLLVQGYRPQRVPQGSDGEPLAVLPNESTVTDDAPPKKKAKK